MQAYIIRRLIAIVPTVIGASLVVFVVMRIMPGDVARLILVGPTGEGAPSQEAVTKLRTELGLDEAIHIQYLEWLGGLIRLDGGNSLWSGESVFSEIGRRLPLTIQLTVMSMVLATLIGIPIGILSAIRQDTAADYIGRVFSIAGLTLPSFWIGILVILALISWFNWTPPLGYEDFFRNPGKNLQQLIWPSLILGYRLAASQMRMARSSILEVVREDYIRTAWAKGLSERVVVIRHVLKNALLPVITIASLEVAFLLGGSVVIEQVFSLPGLGRYLVEAINHRDFPVIQNIVLVIAVIYALVNLLTDLSYAWVDPRIRFG